jgi:multiple sugar transport system ATP-binding protein
MIAGLDDVTGGEIYIDGRLVNGVHPKDRDIAMVFQNYALYPHMTAYDNMAFGLKLRRVPRGEIDQRVREAAEILGIAGLLNRKPKALSGGERQRVAVGRAIVRNPKVFLFDEPLSNLDAKLRVQMRAELSKLHTRLQTTMIYVTHDQVEAMTMGDRIVVMKGGFVQQTADPISLYENPVNRFVAGFIGSPAMNFFDGTLARSDGSVLFRNDDLAIPLPSLLTETLAPLVGKSVTLGCRPEHFLIGPALATGAGRLRARVEVVEPMGNETILYLSIGKASAVARLSVRGEPSVGSELELSIDPGQIRLFDAETEHRLA